jgi:hypothetical protein
MKFAFTQLYPEPDTDFDLSSRSLRCLSEHLNAEERSLAHFTKIFKGEEYRLVSVISATRNRETLEVKGPVYLRAQCAVEFYLWLPYRKLDFVKRVHFVFSSITEGLIQILSKYHGNPAGIKNAVDSAITTVISASGHADELL